MPQLAAIDKRYKSKGLQMIGIHCQDGTDEEILDAVKRTKVKYSIARTGNSPIAVSGIPHMFIFNPKGELVFDGHSADDEAEKTIKRELRNVAAPAGGSAGSSAFTPPASTAPLVAERTWTSTDGRTLVATLVLVDGENGKFKRKDGVAFALPLARLSDADQKVITDAKSKAGDKADDSK